MYTENHTGLLARVVSIFTRRHINIESLTVSKSSMKDIHRFTIVVEVTEDLVKKLVAQLDKQVEVIKSFYYLTEDIVYQEIALSQDAEGCLWPTITLNPLSLRLSA